MRSSCPCSRRNSERWNPSGKGWRIVSAMTRGPANPMSARGSARMTSPSIAKAQRIGADEPGVPLLERAAIGQRGDALAGADAEGIPAFRAHPPGALDLGPVDDLLAGVALDPQALGDDDLLAPALRLVLPSEPGHGLPRRAQWDLQGRDEVADVADQRRRARTPL